MRGHRGMIAVGATLSVLLLGALAVRSALAHCDGMDGPVVRAAQRAFESGNVNLALIWVRQEDEAQLRTAFQEALAVRRLSPEGRQLADRAFFETLVRLHRTGEGAAYTGLKPAGRDLGPAIPAADRALEAASAEALQQLLSRAVQDGLRQQFQRVMSRRNYDPNDVAAGRAYVQSYVEYVHYVERLYESATRTAAGHYAEAER